MKTYKQLQLSLEKVQSGGSVGILFIHFVLISIDVSKLPKPLKSKASTPAKQTTPTTPTTSTTPAKASGAKVATPPTKAPATPKAKATASTTLSADDMEEPNP